MKKHISFIFIILEIVLLVSLFCMYFFHEQKEISGSEELATFPEVHLKSYFTGTYQQDLEQALKDQFALRSEAVTLKKSSNAALGKIYKSVSNFIHGYDFNSGLMPFGDVYRMNGTDWLTNLPYTRSEKDINAYRRKAEEINSFSKLHPQAHFYIYYCTRAEDMNGFDQIDNLESYDYRALLKGLLDDAIRFDELDFLDFNEYCSLMYKTDHHWNNKGAAKGYADLLLMLGRDFSVGQARSILYAEDFDQLRWVGSRARESGVPIAQSDMDIFVLNQYLLPPHRTWLGEKEQSIGLADQYAAGQIERSIGFDQYLNYYGFESKPIRLEYTGSQSANLLIIGDSFARALREPLASHFGTTIYVNFRILDQVDLDEIMSEYNINAVVFIGQQDAWSGYFLKNEVDVQ